MITKKDNEIAKKRIAELEAARKAKQQERIQKQKGIKKTDDFGTLSGEEVEALLLMRATKKQAAETKRNDLKSLVEKEADQYRRKGLFDAYIDSVMELNAVNNDTGLTVQQVREVHSSLLDIPHSLTLRAKEIELEKEKEAAEQTEYVESLVLQINELKTELANRPASKKKAKN